MRVPPLGWVACAFLMVVVGFLVLIATGAEEAGEAVASVIFLLAGPVAAVGLIGQGVAVGLAHHERSKPPAPRQAQSNSAVPPTPHSDWRR